MPHLQAFPVIEAAHPLNIHSPALPLENDLDTPVAIARPRLCDLSDPFAQGCLIQPTRAVVVGRTTGRYGAANASYRYAKAGSDESRSFLFPVSRS